MIRFSSNYKRHAGVQSGFTILELAVVLVIIAVIMGAVSVGGDLKRQADGQKLFLDFITAWNRSFVSYMTKHGGIPPGDDAATPTYRVLGVANKLLCNTEKNYQLSNFMLASGIQLPNGRSELQPDHYIYLDKNGLPHDLQVCFMSVDWSIPGSSVNTYSAKMQNVMVVSGMTPELAQLIDTMTAGRVDARFGRFRQSLYASKTDSISLPWSRTATANINASDNSLEGQSVELIAYLLMD